MRKVADVAAALLAKGMTSDENHHHMYRMQVDGVTTLVTRISHGAKEINANIGSLMARQCSLQMKEFWDLVDCPLSAEDWQALVRERCQGGRNPFIR